MVVGGVDGSDQLEAQPGHAKIVLQLLNQGHSTVARVHEEQKPGSDVEPLGRVAVMTRGRWWSGGCSLGGHGRPCGSTGCGAEPVGCQPKIGQDWGTRDRQAAWSGLRPTWLRP